jgi:hypothetical protein
MKKYGKVLILFSALTLFAVANSRAQIVVRARLGRPHTVMVVRPVRPIPGHVWVSEEWVPAGATYVYREGYWAAPPRPRAIWVPGNWRRHYSGYVWIAGHWRY